MGLRIDTTAFVRAAMRALSGVYGMPVEMALDCLVSAVLPVSWGKL